eukprot:Rmarinus@m.4553
MTTTLLFRPHSVRIVAQSRALSKFREPWWDFEEKPPGFQRLQKRKPDEVDKRLFEVLHKYSQTFLHKVNLPDEKVRERPMNLTVREFLSIIGPYANNGYYCRFYDSAIEDLDDREAAAWIRLMKVTEEEMMDLEIPEEARNVILTCVNRYRNGLPFYLVPIVNYKRRRDRRDEAKAIRKEQQRLRDLAARGNEREQRLKTIIARSRVVNVDELD